MKNNIIYFFLVATSFITSCKNQDANSEASSHPTAANPGTTIKQPAVKVKPQELAQLSNAKPTKMVFTEEEYDFGTIKQGKKVMHVFTFKNTGKNDLIISRAIGSCGCTVPEFPKEPILPGKLARKNMLRSPRTCFSPTCIPTIFGKIMSACKRRHGSSKG